MVVEISHSPIRNRPSTEAALLPEAFSVPSVPDLKDDDHHDGRDQDRSGQYRQYRKHLVVAPRDNARERAEGRFVPRPKLKISNQATELSR